MSIPASSKTRFMATKVWFLALKKSSFLNQTASVMFIPLSPKPSNQTSGAIGFTSKTKKLYKKLGVANDKILFYSVQTGSDKDAAIANAKAQAKDAAAKCVLNDAQKILDQKLGAGKAALTQPKDIFGFARAQEFWANNGGQFKAYSIWQITGLNYIEAGKALANSYLQEHGLLPKGEGSNER